MKIGIYLIAHVLEMKNRICGRDTEQYMCWNINEENVIGKQRMIHSNENI